MRTRDLAAGVVAALLAGAGVAGAAELTGASAPLGQGTVQSYAVIGADGAPTEIGVAFSKGALDGLPAEPNATSRCFDLNGDGKIADHGECDGDYESDLPLPAELTGRDDIPFGWSMVNWGAHGHPPEAWLVPHFDIHFYQIPREAVQAMKIGSCGIFMDCADFELAVKPVPAKYVNPDHINVQAAVGQMGNHLIDSKTPELGNPPQPFTHTWIYGAFDGHVIFHEVMVTRDFLANGGDACADVKQPEAWEKAGYYPTRYCFRHDAEGGLKVFMTDFAKRDAG